MRSARQLRPERRRRARCAARAAALLAACAVVVAPARAGEQSEPARLERVVLVLAGEPCFCSAGYYAARSAGFYEEAGLDVEIRHTEPGETPATDVLAGRAHFGVQGPDLLLLRMEGRPVVALAAILQHSPAALAVPRTSFDWTPRDLAGKSVMLEDSARDAEILAMFRAAGVAAGDLQIVPCVPGRDALGRCDVDAFSGRMNCRELLTDEVRRECRLLKPIHYGIDFYGDTLFTSERELAARPERVAAFREATLRGWHYALVEQEELFDLLLGLEGVTRRETTREILRSEAEATIDLIGLSRVEIGHMEPARWERMAATYASLGMNELPPSLEGFLYVPDGARGSGWTRWILYGGGTVLLIALAVAAWNLQLRRSVKKKAAALLGSEGLYRALTENSSDVTVIMDPSGALRYVSPAVVRILRLRPTDLVGRSLLELVHAEDAPELARALERTNAADSGGFDVIDFRLRDRGGTWVHFEGACANLQDEPGVAGLVVNCRDVTERRQAEREQRLLQQAVDQSSEGVVFLDPDGCVRYVNSAWARMHGYAENEIAGLLGTSVRAFHSRAQIASQVGTFVDTVDREGSCQQELGHVAKDGTTFTTFLSASKVYGEDGERLGTVAVARDATQHRLAERAIRESERRFRAITEYSTDLVAIIDQEWNFRYVSPSVERLGASAPGELIGQSLLKHLHRDDHEAMQLAVQRALVRPGEPIPIHDCRIGNKERTWPHFDATVTAMLDVPGVEGIVVNCREITEHLLAQETLNLWEHLFRHAGLGISVISPESRTLELVNPAFARMTQREIPELIGKPLESVVAPQRREEVGRYLDIVRERGKAIFENEALRADGSTFPVLMDATAVKSEVGSLLYYAVNMQDLTQRKQGERRRESLEAQLRQAQKMEALGTLAAGVAHDFNNLLTAILGYADLARLTASPHGDTSNALDGIRDAALQASRVTGSLLTFSRKGTSEKERVHLGRLVTSSIQMMRRMLPASIEMVTEVPDSDDLWIDADTTQIQQILINLVVNARDAMPEGGKLTVSVLRHPHAAELLVEDTGVGMTEEIRERIFEPFFTTKSRERGTGLGLAVIHGIVGDHGGQIEVDTRERQGTAVHVLLPLCEAPDVQLVPLPHTDEHVTRGETILLAEDNPPVQSLVARILRSEGYRVLLASDGVETMHLWRSHRENLHLIVLDVDLPRRSGLSCLEDIRARQPDLPVLIITGGVGFSLDASGDEATRLLRKPFQVNDLCEAVAKMLHTEPGSISRTPEPGSIVSTLDS